MRKRNINLTNDNQLIEIIEDSEYNIIYVGSENSDLKARIQIVHKLPNLKSRINIKSIVLNNAKFDLEGILKIEKGAYNTDTYLKIECLIVGDNAYARAIPSLEIKESAVKGGHGATIGYIDQNQLDYLYSKGLDKITSENLLISGFIGKEID